MSLNDGFLTQIAANIQFLKFQKEAWNNVTKFDWTNFKNETVKREFEFLNILGPAALNDADALKVYKLEWGQQI